ncbi:transporter [Allorhodopirellula heiligendammensis]|uniref:MetA-pathway of phenol degradation n=1 Tax=Allorhodopirellula heiligendammensis TaxID=2714739 RepID=A0A5C6BT43_9BACT|nr:transporter [Allorhodopirellula heiligendammensis]TWU15393.1 hypothetical protein Poly21_25880 [Allorhodopirellula heiligendammensis]
MPTPNRASATLAILICMAFTTASAHGPFGLFSNLSPATGRSPRELSEEDEIETDRDSFTLATGVVGKSRLVIESAYSFVDNRNVPETHSLPELIARYGITDNFELRLGYNYEVGGAGNPVSGNVPDEFEETADLERGARVIYGAKYRVSRQLGGMPESSVLIQGFTPVRGIDTATQLSATYVFGWQLPNEWEWDSAVRYGTGSFEDDHFNVWSPSTVIKIPVGEKWKFHAEYFSVNTDGRAKESTQQFFSPGAHYLITPNLEIGLRVGWGLNTQTPNFFSNVGGGIRF